MTTAVQHRRGTTAEHATFTGLEGEVTIDTTKDTAVIHDGTLAGGYPLAKENLANVNPTTLSTIDGASTASDDKFLIWDQSALTLKSITRAELNNAMEADALASVTITGGTINGTSIGATTASSGAFTTLAASSTVTLSGGTANGVAYLNGSKVLTSGSALTFDGTGLGVGYATPASVLNDSNDIVVGGTSDALAGMTFLNSSTGSGTIKFADAVSGGASGRGVIEYNHSTDYLGLYALTGQLWNVGGSERMRLTSTGLGIGTSSPSAKLDVVGNLLQTGTTDVSWSGVNAETLGNINLKYSNAATSSSGPSLSFINDAGIFSTRIPYTSSVIKSIHTSSSNNEKYADLAFYTHSGGAGGTGSLTERLRITSSGNVGIGTSSPAANLDVAGISPIIRIGDTQNKTPWVVGDVLGTLEFYSNDASAPGAKVVSSIKSVADISSNAASGALAFSTSTAAGTITERARIDSSGNLLVGTTTNTNSSKLVVNGTISETVSSAQYLVASQADIGTAPNEIPLNGYLGGLAYKDTVMVSVPASASASGSVGQIAQDGSYLYICTAVNTWKRVAIATW